MRIRQGKLWFDRRAGPAHKLSSPARDLPECAVASFRVPQGFRFPEKRRAGRHSLSAFRHARAVCPDGFPGQPDPVRKNGSAVRMQPGISSALSLFFASYACIIENMTAGSAAAAAVWRGPGERGRGCRPKRGGREAFGSIFRRIWADGNGSERFPMGKEGTK